MELGFCKYLLIYFYAMLCSWLLLKHFSTAVFVGHHKNIDPLDFPDTNLTGLYPAEKIAYIWTTIYSEFEKEFYFAHINTEKYFDATFESPDYDTDAYFVPKQRKYCLANFLYTLMNKKENLSTRRLFFDYVPSNALKQELQKTYTLANKDIYETYVSKRVIEKRKGRQ
jgi:hypothetical protein